MLWAIYSRCQLSLVVLCLLLLSFLPINAYAVTFAWDANSEPDLAGYKIYRGCAPGVYDTVVDVGNVTQYTITGLALGQIYYFAATAYDTNNNESDFSNEILYAIILPPTNGSIIWEEIIDPQGTCLKMGRDYETVFTNGRWIIIYDHLGPGDFIRIED